MALTNEFFLENSRVKSLIILMIPVSCMALQLLIGESHVWVKIVPLEN